MVGEEWQVGLSPTSVAASQLKPLLGSPLSCNSSISELSGSALLSLISTQVGVMARHFPSVCRQVFLLKSCLRMGGIISLLALRPLPLRDWSSGGNGLPLPFVAQHQLEERQIQPAGAFRHG